MDELQKKLEELKAQLKLLTDKALKAVTANDAVVAKEHNDKAAEVKALVVETERAIKALEEQEAERKTEAEKAEADRKAEIERLADEKAKAMVKNLGLDRPDYTAGESDDTPPELAVPLAIQRIAITSPYDRFGLLDLSVRAYLKMRGAQVGITQKPSERMMRALAVRANVFMNEEDDVPYITRYGEVKSRRLPAFDPTVILPWSSQENAESVFVEGIGNVPHKDNVTPDGIKNLMGLAVKANDLVYSTYGGYGSQWVPTLMAAVLWRTIRMETKVLGLFDGFDMPSQPYDYPRESTDPVIYGVAETTDIATLLINASTIPDSKIGTAKTTFSAGKIGAMTPWSEEMDEDSIIAVQPQFRDQYGLAMAHGIDSLLINGDETTTTLNISYYGTSLGSTDKYLQVDGLRHEPLVTTATDNRDGGSLTVDDINATRKLMGTLGVNGADPTQLVILCDIPCGFKFEDLSEVMTVDKFGDDATILRGQLGRIKSIPLIKSQDYFATDSSGYINDTTGDNTLGSFLVINRLGVKVGWRRRPRILVGQIPYSDAWYILALARLDIGFFGTGMVAMSRNITV